MQKSWRIIFTTLLAFAATNLQAQYYSWGADAPMKWSKIKCDSVSVLYPDKAEGLARQTLHYIDAVSPYIAYGYEHPPLNIPYVLHVENFNSNGMVMWAPKRIEFLTSPNIDGFSMPWIKQLVAHEYRHAVQYNNLNQNMVKGLSYVLGQQLSLAALALISTSIIEGDAVLTETQFSSFGRGLQPSFSMGYRALADDLLSYKNLDYWYCGSYRTYTPDHYELGYQLASYSDNKYQENIWDKTIAFAARRPYYLVTTRAALKRYYNTTPDKLLLESFEDLRRHWASIPTQEDSNEIISQLDTTNYTTYSHPIPMGDGQLLALKSDYEKPSRFVIFDTESRQERVVAYTGSISTRPTLSDEGRVWWSEYRRSKLFDERVYSQLCYMDLSKGKPRVLKGANQSLYPTAMRGGDIAYIKYEPTGHYTLVELRDGLSSEITIPFPAEIHGLAWDDVTDRLYVLVTDDSGMWLGVKEEDSFRQLTQGAYITLSDLRAGGGELYFGSIASGYDEQHKYIIATGENIRTSRSRYGSFDPSTESDGYSYGTTYDRYGYHLSRSRVDAVAQRVEATELPENIVNPERREWNILNLDTVSFTTIDSLSSIERKPSRRYRKGAHLIKVHSWLPVALNPAKLIEDQSVSVNWGATLLSQNLLSSAEGTAMYGWSSREGSLVSANLDYSGLGVDLDLGFSYGGDQLLYSLPNQNIPQMDKYYSVSAIASLPIYLTSGYQNRWLNIYSGWNYNNGLVAELDQLQYDLMGQLTDCSNIGFKEGIHKLVFGASFSSSATLAERDFITPWGYAISTSYSMSPNNRDFSDLVSSYVKLYTPGIMPHHSFSLSACYQTSIGGAEIYGYKALMFQSASLLPHGVNSSDIVNDDYIATSANYSLPIWYPEGGIPFLIYFRRIRLSMGGDYAQYNYWGNTERLYSYGGALTFDVNVFRTPGSSTCGVSLQLYNNNRNGLWIGGGLELPF